MKEPDYFAIDVMSPEGSTWHFPKVGKYETKESATAAIVVLYNNDLRIIGMVPLAWAIRVTLC